MQMLWHRPELVDSPCKKEYANIRWRNNEQEFERWCEGRTGYPLVDAGMRERAHRINGTIEVEGVPGLGTIVSLRIPLQERQRRSA